MCAHGLSSGQLTQLLDQGQLSGKAILRTHALLMLLEPVRLAVARGALERRRRSWSRLGVGLALAGCAGTTPTMNARVDEDHFRY